jgi:hypothetical protein
VGYETRGVGVQVHGYGIFLYYADETLPGGADITCAILCDVLQRLYEVLPAAKKIVVYIQADNCGENKNKVVFSTMELLMKMAMRERGVELRFENNYLLVNHTHEDIDQVFKCIADLIRHHQDTIMFDERWAAVAKLSTPERHFLVQIALPCAYGFHGLLGSLIDKELHYYKTPHHICLYWGTINATGQCAVG